MRDTGWRPSVGERARRRGAWWNSVRARTTAAATVVVAIALTATGLILLAALRGNLVESADLQAANTARDIAGQLEAGTPLAQLRLPDPDDEPVQVVSADGRVLAADEELRGRGPMADFGADTAADAESGDDEDEDSADDESDEAADEDDEDDSEAADEEDSPGSGDTAAGLGTGSTAGSGGTKSTRAVGASAATEPVFGQTEVAVGDSGSASYRVAALDSTAPDGQPVTVYAGSSLDTADSAVADLRRAMLIGLPVLLAVVAAVTWLVTRWALRPVESIRSELAEIMHGDLSRRVPEPAARDEIARLAVTTNDTLAALEQSAERQRRFIADAAHELRSPIASLRTQLEVAQAHPGLLELDGLLGDTVRLEHLAADLLLLARLDAGEQPRADRIELTELVREELAHRVGDRLPVGAGLDVDELAVTGSRTQLARVLGNLVDNAQRHAATTVRVTLERRNDRAVLTVADDGPGVPEADRERIFQRFVRLDDARSRDEGGAGLGLAIVRDVVGRHEGIIRVEPADSGGARFVVELPVAR
ncbi:HAMP domain-containing histidine kinase [Nocardia zapadnayensis]|uniref:sensor histidine kinase n=1 Tax=Nocardia rhamnosiphila TaxID=426716 RepID=UPI002246DFB0|nr:HAMP domain-containing sensor histidine kinase [Nocardia zapadnayensis]MCX0275686.1 HAMP domain-containing histidine kinase [Nocardia zapadnayensis]